MCGKVFCKTLRERILYQMVKIKSPIYTNKNSNTSLKNAQRQQLLKIHYTMAVNPSFLHFSRGYNTN